MTTRARRLTTREFRFGPHWPSAAVVQVVPGRNGVAAVFVYVAGDGMAAGAGFSCPVGVGLCGRLAAGDITAAGVLADAVDEGAAATWWRTEPAALAGWLRRVADGAFDHTGD